MSKRTNEQWLTDLRAVGSAREAALADLRQILMSGLRRGLLNHVNTSIPEFDTLAEDFVQEALLRILDKIDTFAGRSQFTTWAHKIAVSVALTELRRKRWQDRSLDALTTQEEGDYTPSFLADPAPKPEKTAEQIDMLTRVNQVIMEELTEKQRQALMLSVVNGLPTMEVAKQMNMKPNALYKLLHDARLRLKRRLADQGLTAAEVIAAFE